jgi:hypothetical protein
LACCHHMFAHYVDIHVVDGGFTGNVRGSLELRAWRLLEGSEHDRLVGSAAQQLETPPHGESQGGDRSRVVVNGLNMLVLFSSSEDVDESVSTCTAHELETITERGVLDAEDLSVVCLDLKHDIHELQLIHPDVASSVSQSQLVASWVELGTADTSLHVRNCTRISWNTTQHTRINRSQRQTRGRGSM